MAFVCGSHLDLSGNDLLSLPDGLLDAQWLRTLDLSENAITGTLSADISARTYMESLSLGNNMFSGKVPAELSWLSFMTALNLSGNAFTGFAASALDSLQSLVYVVVHRDARGCACLAPGC